MEDQLNFDGLVSLCQDTHREMQQRAARSVDTALVARNFLFGWYIVEFEQNGRDYASYGDATLERLAEKLKDQIGRGFSVINLRLMRRFFIEFQDQIPAFRNRQTLSVDSTAFFDLPSIASLGSAFTLSWSHYVSLLTLSNPEERRFYEIEAAQNSWSLRELERQVDSSLFERLSLSRNKEEIRQLAEEGLIVEKAADIIKNPYVLEFLGLEQKPGYSEEQLETAIIDKLQCFLLELGKGFLFEARQRRFTFDNDHFYVDLVFYNRLLNSYVLIDLKRDKLTHQDLGQMQMYVNYFDREVITDTENPTIGIVMCHRRNEALVELTLPENANIFASEYQLYLPSKEVLKAQLEQIESEAIRELERKGAEG